MRDTEESEMAEVQASTESLARARASLALAELAAARSRGPFDPLTEDAAKEWVRTSIAERRHTDAFDAQIAGGRRRDRLANLLAPPPIFLQAGPDPPVIVSVKRTPSSNAETHRATLAFIAGIEKRPHSEDEDIHPARLDESATDLDRALAGK
jgi:hypothetical protein